MWKVGLLDSFLLEDKDDANFEIFDYLLMQIWGKMQSIRSLSGWDKKGLVFRQNLLIKSK